VNATSTTIAKVAGWGQFVFQLLGQVLGAGGIPTSPLGWLGLVGSLAAAVGIHAAAVSPGTPTK